jgi:hypothetical protein
MRWGALWRPTGKPNRPRVNAATTSVAIVTR